MSDEIWNRVDSHMRIKYGVGLDSLDITETPGYWRDKEARFHVGHPLHSCFGCNGAFKATYTYFDTMRANGRFASPTRSWRAIRESFSKGRQ